MPAVSVAAALPFMALFMAGRSIGVLFSEELSVSASGDSITEPHASFMSILLAGRFIVALFSAA